ncbi:hypothetical protein DYB36_013731, partial [Aphanomyces astaci]
VDTVVEKDIGIIPSGTNPIFLCRESTEVWEWRVRNLPYPKDTYLITIDESSQELIIRTTNKKYFKRFRIPAMARANLPLDRSALSHSHSNNTLVIQVSFASIVMRRGLVALVILDTISMHADGVKKAALEALSSRVLDGRGLRIGICTTEWNKEIIDALRDGAIRTLTAAGVATDDIIVFKAPGAYELPFTASRLILSENVDAVICVGCLIKGETMHFEYICEAVTQGIMKLNLDTGVPVMFGVLAVLNEKQARARAGLEEGGHNHGVEWAQTAIEMAQLRARTAKKSAAKCPYHVIPACPFVWTTALAVLGYGLHLVVCRKHN